MDRNVERSQNDIFLPQNVNYSPPPTLIKHLYATFVQSFKLLLYFILPYPWVYIVDVQYGMRCSNSKFSLYRFKYYVFLMRVRQIFVSLFVRPHGTTCLSLANFHEFSVRLFWKICRENSSLIKI